MYIVQYIQVYLLIDIILIETILNILNWHKNPNWDTFKKLQNIAFQLDICIFGLNFLSKHCLYVEIFYIQV